jgi:uncharacterized membrane protein
MKQFFLYLMAAIYAAAGVYHFVKPGFYLKLMPTWLPWPGALVFWSGVAEILLALLLIPDSTRAVSAWLIIAMLVVFFFTIHIPQTIDFYQRQSRYLTISVIRLPIQFVLVWWAWLYTKS